MPRDTIVAIATPPGKGGIGIIRLSGKDCLQIAGKLVTTGIRPRSVHYCNFRDSHGSILDSGLLLYFKAPNSFTGEDVIELHGHGGDVVLNLLLRETLSCGARLARPGEFTERAFLNGRMDLIQAEATADLIDSASEQAARSAARSLEGEFSRHVNRMLETLVNIRVFVESSLDFPDEEIDFLTNSGLMGQMDELVDHIDTLLMRSRKGRVLRKGLRAAIIGRPNVGKSSLLNALARTDRAIVTEIAGTTRDTIEETVHLDGIVVTIVDTAGIRETLDVVEQEGVRRSLAEAGKADVMILVKDTEDDFSIDSEISAKASQSRLIVLHNKIDLHKTAATERIIDGVMHICVSAKTGDGLERLIEALKKAAGLGETSEDVILARERHILALETGKKHLEKGRESYKETDSAELLAEELRMAQKAIGEITGVFHAEDLLGEIFSRFCIGK